MSTSSLHGLSYKMRLTTAVGLIAAGVCGLTTADEPIADSKCVQYSGEICSSSGDVVCTVVNNTGGSCSGECSGCDGSATLQSRYCSPRCGSTCTPAAGAAVDCGNAFPGHCKPDNGGNGNQCECDSGSKKGTCNHKPCT